MKPHFWLAVGLLWSSAFELPGTLTVNYGAYPGRRDVIDSSDVPVPDGNYVAIGTFTSGFNVVANAGHLDTLYSSWLLFDSTAIKHLPPFGSPTPGRFADSASVNDARFDNQPIYLWIFKTTDNSVPDFVSFDNVAEYGLFTSTASGWVFRPHDTAPPGNVMNLNSSELNWPLFGAIVAGSPGHLQLDIPEPSGGALLAGAALLLALVVEIRRRARMWSNAGPLPSNRPTLTTGSGGKSEIRNPKSERNPKAEIRRRNRCDGAEGWQWLFSSFDATRASGLPKRELRTFAHPAFTKPKDVLKQVLIVAASLWTMWESEAAITVNYHAGPGARAIVDATGQPLAGGCAVRLGTLRGPAETAAHGGNVPGLTAAWTPFAETVIRPIMGQPGRFAAVGSSGGGTIEDQPAWLWILKTADGQPPASGGGNVVEYGLFRSRQPHWHFPTTVGSPPWTTVLSSLEVDEALWGFCEANSLKLALVVPSPTPTYAQWVAARFSPGTPSAETAAGADPDQDGAGNLVEYLFGSDPRAPDRVGLRVRRAEGGEGARLVVVAEVRAEGAEAGLEVEQSADLRTWGPVRAEPVRQVLASGLTRLEYQFPVEAGPLFLRARVRDRR